jgi:hypothetical protein
MTGRPDLDAMEAVLLDERGRLRPGARRMVVAEFRCQRRRHQQGVIVRTVHGPVLMWRAETGSGAGWQWARDWLDVVHDSVLMTCHCRVTRSVDLTPYRPRRAIS